MESNVELIGKDTFKITEGKDAKAVYCYLLKGSEAAMLIDTGYGTIPIDEIVKGQMGDIKKLYVVLTHGHVDHLGGTGLFEQVYMDTEDKETYIAHSNLDFRKIFIAEETVIKEPAAIEDIGDISDIFISDVDLGDRVISLIKTPGHSLGCVCFYDQRNKWLFTGDMCCKADVLLNMGYASSLEGYLQSIEKILSFDFDATWPGHHAVPVFRETIEQFRDAAQLYLDGKLTGELVDHPAGKARRVAYKDIAIIMEA